MEPEMLITVQLEGYEFGTNRPRDPESLWKINSATPDMQLPLEDALAGMPTKIAAGGISRDISHVAKALSDNFRDDISVVPANEKTFLNITGINASKPDTLRRLLDSRNIPLDDVVAFGDDIPDIRLMKACGIAIAVANAI